MLYVQNIENLSLNIKITLKAYVNKSSNYKYKQKNLMKATYETKEGR